MRTRNMTYRTMVLAGFGLLLALPPVHAQSEGGLLLGAEVEKKVDKKLSLGVEAGFRSRNDFRTADRWTLSLGADYKLTKWLKADAAYKFIHGNNREKISYHTNANGQSTGYNNWRPSYWSDRHRLTASLTAGYKLANNLHLSLRERWQYTYRPESSAQRWDFDHSKWEEKVRSGKGKNQLRSRFQVAYDKKKARLKPYASVELYNAWSVEKLRYTLGTDWKLDKHHSLDVFYRFQDVRQTDDYDYDPSMHYLGIGYQFKF